MEINCNVSDNGVFLKSLSGAKMKIIHEDAQSILANIAYNHNTVHITYYKELPQYVGDEPVRICDNVLIHEWYQLDKNPETIYETVDALRHELQDIFNRVWSERLE